MSAPDLETLYQFEKEFEDAAETFLESAVGISCFPSASGENFVTPRLEDLATYTWRVTPYDQAGNAGTALTIGPEKVVRRPDAPRWAWAFNDSTQRATFSAAS